MCFWTIFANIAYFDIKIHQNRTSISLFFLFCESFLLEKEQGTFMVYLSYFLLAIIITIDAFRYMYIYTISFIRSSWVMMNNLVENAN